MGSQVRLKERTEHWLAPILPPTTVLMGWLAISAPIHRNAGHEFGGLPRCPDDPLNKRSREVPWCFPREVGVLMHHRDGAGEPTHTGRQAVFNPPRLGRGEGSASCGRKENEMADGDDGVARS
jgi:hypothetical protein